MAPILRDIDMKKRNTFMMLGSLALVGLVAYVFYPSSSIAGSGTYRINPDISIGAHRSDTALIGESYERILGSYIGGVERRLAVTDREAGKVSKKLDAIDKKIDLLGKRLERIEKALNITTDIPKPKSPPSENINQKR
jgi:hypothetical protein